MEAVMLPALCGQFRALLLRGGLWFEDIREDLRPSLARGQCPVGRGGEAK